MRKAHLIWRQRCLRTTYTTKYGRSGKPVYCADLALRKSERFSTDDDKKLRLECGENHIDPVLIALEMGRNPWEVRARLRELRILKRRRANP